MTRTVRILASLLAFVLLISLSACIGPVQPAESSQTEPVSSSDQPASAAESASEPSNSDEPDASLPPEDESSEDVSVPVSDDPKFAEFLSALEATNDLYTEGPENIVRVFMDPELLNPGEDRASWKAASEKTGVCYAMGTLTAGGRTYTAYAQEDFLLYGENDLNTDTFPTYCKVEKFQTDDPEPYGLLEPVYEILSGWKELLRAACGRLMKQEGAAWAEEEGVPYGEEGYAVTNQETGERLFLRKDFYGNVYVGLEFLDGTGSRTAYAQLSPPEDESFELIGFDAGQTVPAGRFKPFARDLKEASDALLGTNG